MMEADTLTGGETVGQLDPEISLFVDMGIGIDDILKHIKRRFDEGWAMLVGDPEFIDIIENTIYSVDTDARQGLEIVAIDPPLYLIKKTTELRVYLHGPDVFDKSKVIFAHREKLPNDVVEDKVFMFPPDMNSNMDAETEGLKLARDMLEMRFLMTEAGGI